jgi:glucose-6-phosphate dehydrogenase assembly protein OpcA
MLPRNRFSEVPAVPPRPVEVSQIERELGRLWESAMSGPEENLSTGQPGVTRACSLNLVIFCGNQAVVDRATEVVAAIMPQHPCRALLLLAEVEASHAQMEAWLSAHCSVSGSGGPQVCCEQITIRASGRSVMHLAEAVRPLLVPDLPVVLWWPTVMAWDEPLSRALNQEADRIIVDTGGWRASDPLFRGLAEYMQENRRAVVSDLNWFRLLAWRELAAQFFDPLDFRAYLDHLSEAVVECAAEVEGPTDSSGAVLMAAWLASCLGWTWTGHRPGGVEEEESWLFQRDGVEIAVALRGRWDPSLSPGEITSLRLVAGHGRPPATFLLRRTSPSLVFSAVEVPAACPLPRMIGIDRHDEAHLLCGVLEEVGRDRVYEAALGLATQMHAEAPEIGLARVVPGHVPNSFTPTTHPRR